MSEWKAAGDDHEQRRAWVRNWQEVGPLLQAIRHAETRRTDTLVALAALAGAFDHAVQTCPPRPTSGLVDQQAMFARLRR